MSFLEVVGALVTVAGASWIALVVGVCVGVMIGVDCDLPIPVLSGMLGAVFAVIVGAGTAVLIFV